MLSLIPEASGQTYQGVVEINEDRLAANLERYFALSEQLPTLLQFATRPGEATGLLLQRLPDSDTATELELDSFEAFWQEVVLLTRTLKEHELASAPFETLLSRLYAERLIKVQPPRSLRFACTCNRDKTQAILRSMGRVELLELLQQEGEIYVTCEVCGVRQAFDAVDVHLLLEHLLPLPHQPGSTPVH